MSETLAEGAGVITWALSAFAITARLGHHISYEQPILPALVIVVGVLVMACLPAIVVYSLARPAGYSNL